MHSMLLLSVTFLCVSFPFCSGLAASLGVGTTVELTRRSLGLVDGQKDRLANNPFFSPANMERIVSTLCRMRGAALKLGQMISLQGRSVWPGHLSCPSLAVLLNSFSCQILAWFLNRCKTFFNV